MAKDVLSCRGSITEPEIKRPGWLLLVKGGARIAMESKALTNLGLCKTWSLILNCALAFSPTTVIQV